MYICNKKSSSTWKCSWLFCNCEIDTSRSFIKPWSLGPQHLCGEVQLRYNTERVSQSQLGPMLDFESVCCQLLMMLPSLLWKGFGNSSFFSEDLLMAAARANFQHRQSCMLVCQHLRTVGWAPLWSAWAQLKVAISSQTWITLHAPRVDFYINTSTIHLQNTKMMWVEGCSLLQNSTILISAPGGGNGCVAWKRSLFPAGKEGLNISVWKCCKGDSQELQISWLQNISHGVSHSPLCWATATHPEGSCSSCIGRCSPDFQVALFQRFLSLGHSVFLFFISVFDQTLHFLWALGML